MIFIYTALPAAAASFGIPAQEETVDQLPEESEGEMIEGEIDVEIGSDISDFEEGEILPDESGDPAVPEEIPLEGDTLQESTDSTLSEKVDPFTESGVLDVFFNSVVADDSGVELYTIPASSPIGGFYTEVTSSIGAGDLFVPSEFAHDYLTFDGTGKMVCLANTTVNALLVTDSQVIQVRFPAMSYPQYYTQTGSNYNTWVDFSITSAQDGNVQVMQQFDFAWISSNLYQACILLIGGLLVCRLFMSK